MVENLPTGTYSINVPQNLGTWLNVTAKAQLFWSMSLGILKIKTQIWNECKWCLFVRTHVFIETCIYMHTFIHIYKYKYIHMYVWVHVYTYI